MLLAFGPNASRMVNGAITGGMTTQAATAYTEPSAVADALERLTREGDVILVKGSRGMRMERILAQFLKEK
jgi:UDP-N-acetylmuramoyl-tripeptide--D-alanyl-D-alanine ligase